MNQEIALMITNVLVALLSAGGFWAFLESIPTKRKEKREEKYKKLETTLDTMTDKVDALIPGADIIERFDKLENKLDEAEKLSLATARDRLNYNAEKYLSLGYIPTSDIIAFKLLGNAYIEAGGNSEIRTKFEHCINELEVK